MSYFIRFIINKYLNGRITNYDTDKLITLAQKINFYFK